MRDLSAESAAGLAAAITAIDAANAQDPNQYQGQPLAQRQGVVAQRWVERLEAAASPALILAARAHHLRRWMVPRRSYPDGRQGYLRWRRDQKTRHAEELRRIVLDSGMGAAIAVRAAEIVTKTGLGSDPEVQVFEDAVALTFIETQFASTAERVDDDDKMVDIVAKTLAKMSPAGREAAGGIALSRELATIVDRAMGAP